MMDLDDFAERHALVLLACASGSLLLIGGGLIWGLLP